MRWWASLLNLSAVYAGAVLWLLQPHCRDVRAPRGWAVGRLRRFQGGLYRSLRIAVSAR